jgi:acyl-coenzyme A thioesterase PaaI-like protein
VEYRLVAAEGCVRSLGKPVGFAEASLTDAEGRLYTSATSALLVLDGAPGSAKE